MKPFVVLILYLLASTSSFQLQQMHYHRRAKVLVGLSQIDLQSEDFPQDLKKNVRSNLEDAGSVDEEMKVTVENEQFNNEEMELKEAEYLIDDEESDAMRSKNGYDMRPYFEKKRLAIRNKRYNIDKIRLNEKAIRFNNEIKDRQLIHAIDAMVYNNKEKERIYIEEMLLLLDEMCSKNKEIGNIFSKERITIMQMRSRLDRERSSLKYGLSYIQQEHLNYEEEVYNNEIKIIQLMLPNDNEYISYYITRKDFFSTSQQYMFFTGLGELVRFDNIMSDEVYYADYKSFASRWL